MQATRPAVEVSVTAPPRRRRIVAMLNLVFLVLGLILFVLLVLKLDTAEVGLRLRGLGWGFVGLMILFVLGALVSTAAWRSVIDPARSRARFIDLLVAFWAGSAVNAVTPGGTFGEVFRGTLMRDKVDSEEIVASLVIFNFMGYVSMLLFNLLGPLLCLLLLDLPLRVVAVVFVLSLAFFLPCGLVYFFLRRGAAGIVVAVIRRLPLVRLRDPAGLLEKAHRIDRCIAEFRIRRPRQFAAAVAWLAVARLVQAADYLVLLPALVPGRSLLWLGLVTLLIHSTSQLLSWALTFIPSQIGVAEGKTALLFRLLGFDPVVGLTMEIVRHLRAVIGIALGLLLGWITVLLRHRAAARQLQGNVHVARGARGTSHAAS